MLGLAHHVERDCREGEGHEVIKPLIDLEQQLL
jgi:hypothetical protein